ncbi:MAG: glycosyltransferase family 4 protein [Acetobacteraceae bacterium]|nr:glycosyltransferase family 4 protein [Acetobacteraceae bacterium]
MALISVLALCRYSRLGSASRLRFLDMLPVLRQHGVLVDVCSFFDDEYLVRLYAGRRIATSSLLGYYTSRFRTLLDRSRHDLIWLEKEAVPWLPWPIERLLLGGRPVAVDFDDAWYLRYQKHPNPLVRAALSGKLPALVRASRLTIVGSAHLGAWARRMRAPRVLELPTTVDLSRYQIASGTPGSDFTIGWIGSPANAATYLPPLAGVFAELTAEAGVRLDLVGSGPIALDGAKVHNLPWSEADEGRLIGGFDVGIMPLHHDEWSEGKCAYKLIQYMASGLPVVASPVGMNRVVVQDGVNGFLADTPEQWRTALLTLRADPALRRRMGAVGRALVEAEFSHLKVGHDLAMALRQAAAE